MTNQRLSPEEQQFLRHVGLAPDDLEHLAADAPPLPADTVRRLQAQARQKAGIATAPSLRRPPRRALRGLAAAAAVVLALAGALAVMGPERVQAALQRLMHFVPGVGIAATDERTLVLAAPVTTETDGRVLTITGVLSDNQGTAIHVRIDGPPENPGKAHPGPPPEPGARATLTLPDGSRLTGGYSISGSSRWLEGGLWFNPLPPGTSSVQLDLPPVRGDTPPFAVTIPLTPVAEAGLSPAHTGPWADVHHGVRVGAPHIAFDGNRIIVNLTAEAAAAGARIEGLADFDTNAWPTLTDDLGNTYPRVPAESTLSPGTARPGTATFSGPVAAGAAKLYLTVPVVRVRQPLQDTLVLPHGRLTPGEPLAVNRTLRAGDLSFQVRSATRISTPDGDDMATIRLDLDLGPEQDGRLLQHVQVAPPAGRPGAHTSRWQVDPATGQTLWQDVSYTPQGRYLTLHWEAVFRLRGPWEMELPAR